MLEPYIVERGTFLLVGQRVTLGGSSPSAEDIGWLWQHSGQIFAEINNKVEGCFYGVSLDFQYGPDRGEDARHAYLIALEVTQVEKLAFDHESLVVPASEWLSIPIRYDDPEVLSLAPPELQGDAGYLSGCVFGWGRLWCEENGYTPLNWPMGLEVYGLTRGYEAEGGPEVTFSIPVSKLA